MSLVSHLEELRARLLFALLAVGLGIVAGWLLYPLAYRLLALPVQDIVVAHGGEVFTREPFEAFFTRVKLSVALGVALASPVLIWQLWAFTRPGLLPRERRMIAPFMPGISVLFLLGAGVAYHLLPRAMAFFLTFVPAGVSADIDFQSSVNFPLKLLIAFGLAFQLPVVLLGLVWLRVLSPGTLLAQWRVSVVALGILAGVITPTGDPLSWIVMLIPLFVLYFGTVLVAYRCCRSRDAGGEA